MNAVVIPVPETWRMPRPPRLDYVVADGVEVAISVVQGLPEDPPEWIKNEIARRAGGKSTATPAVERVRLDSGWPALVVEAEIGADKLLLIMYQFLELGAVATLSAPAALFDAHRAAVRAVLLQAQIKWGKRPVTLAELLDGAVRDKEP